MSKMETGRWTGMRIHDPRAATRRPLRDSEVPTRPLPRIIAASVYHACRQIGAEWRARHGS
jgi:hypothetical protein